MSFSRLSMGIGALVLAALTVPGSSTAAGNRADGAMLPDRDSSVAGVSVGSSRIHFTKHQRVPAHAGEVTTAMHELDLSSLNVADFGDEPAPSDRQ